MRQNKPCADGPNALKYKGFRVVVRADLARSLLVANVPGYGEIKGQIVSELANNFVTAVNSMRPKGKEQAMYYDEDWIDGYLHFRTNPTGAWELKANKSKEYMESYRPGVMIPKGHTAMPWQIFGRNDWTLKLQRKTVNELSGIHKPVWDEPAKDDLVNHPPHYTNHPSGIECIQVTEHMGFNLGNAVKYIWRADLKGKSEEDLKKAIWYLERELSKREKENGINSEKEES